jgi:hypothetical protein
MIPLLATILILQTSSALGQTSTIVAGTGESGFSGDGGAAIDAQLSVPSSVFVDVDGNITIADTSKDR